MKHLISMVLFVFLACVAQAQITNIVSVDSSLVVNQLYAGALQATNFSTDSISASPWTGVRLGGRATYAISPKWKAQSFFVLDQNSSNESGTIQSFVVLTQVTDKLLVSNGFGPQVGTFLHRPLPPTAFGQFEPWTKAQVPGGGFVSRVSYQFEKFGLQSSVRYAENPEYHFGFTTKKLQASGWYQENGVWGGAVSFSGDRLFTTTLVNQSHIGQFFVISFGEKLKNLKWYGDIGYSHEFDEVSRAETGILKSFSIHGYPLSGLFGCGYSYEQRAVRGYLMINLSD